MLMYRTLRRGKQRLYVHRGVEADSSAESTTPSEPVGKMQDEMGRLEQVCVAAWCLWPAHDCAWTRCSQMS
jgi:hypothetical protein